VKFADDLMQLMYFNFALKIFFGLVRLSWTLWLEIYKY